MGIKGKLDIKTKPLALLTGRRMKSRGLVYIYPMPRAMEKIEHPMCINDRSGSISPKNGHVNSYNYYVNDYKVGSTEVMPKWEISIFRELPEIRKKKSAKQRVKTKAKKKK